MDDEARPDWLSWLNDGKSVYLGDGAYMRPGGYPGEIILFTTNGIDIRNSIYLGPTELNIMHAQLKKWGIAR